MSENSATGVRSLVSRYRKGFALGAGTMLVHLAIVATLVYRAVEIFEPGLTSRLIGAGMRSTTAELAAPVAIHVVCGVLLFVFYTQGVRSKFYNRSRDGGLYPLPYYSWAMDFVEERQLGGAGAEEWAETPPTWVETTAALGIGVFVLTFGLLATGAPVVGLALATGAHGFARSRGLRPVRPLSWHLALATLLVVVATVFLSALLHFDAVDAWFQTVSGLFMGSLTPFTDYWLLIALLTMYLSSLVAAHMIVTYVGVYYLLVATDGVQIRAGLVPSTERAAEPEEKEEGSAGRMADDGGALDGLDSADSQYSAMETRTDGPETENPPAEGHAPPALLGSVAAFVLLLAVVLPLADDTAVGAASVMFFSGLSVCAVVIFVGIPTESVVGGVFAGVVLGAFGGLAVHTASVVGAVTGGERTALFAMAMWVGAVVGLLGWAAIVADRSMSR